MKISAIIVVLLFLVVVLFLVNILLMSSIKTNENTEFNYKFKVWSSGNSMTMWLIVSCSH